MGKKLLSGWNMFLTMFSRQLLIYLGIVLVSSCTLREQRPTPTLGASSTAAPPISEAVEMQRATFRLGDDPEQRPLYSFTGRIETDRTAFTVIIRNVYDPSRLWKDDELMLFTIIQSSSPLLVPVGEPIDFPFDDLPLEITVAAACFCDRLSISEGSGQQKPNGTIYFEILDATEVRGWVELHLRGDIPYFSVEEPFFEDLWKVDTSLDLYIPEFVAKPRE